MKLQSLLVAAPALHLILFGASPIVDPIKSGMDPQALARIPARMKAYVDTGALAGSVTLIQRHGVLASLEAIGYQDLDSKKPMRSDTIIEIFSMTKPVTAIGVMMMLEAGKLTLSDPVEKHLPEFRGLWMIDGKPDPKQRVLKRPSRKITIRDLLTHTSGMSGEQPAGMKELINPEFKCDLSLTEAVLAYSQQPLEFEPGSRFRYSNLGIATLGRIIEVTSGLPFEKFMEERIFKPLGMVDSFLFPPENKKARIATLYEMVNGKLKSMGDVIYRKGARYSMPEGGMYTTAVDLVKLYQMMLNGGNWEGKRLLSRASVELMTMNHIGDLPTFGSMAFSKGLGWTIVRAPFGQLSLMTPGAYGHSGAGGTNGWADPRKDMITLFLIQRYPGHASDDIFNTFEALAYAALND